MPYDEMKCVTSVVTHFTNFAIICTTFNDFTFRGFHHKCDTDCKEKYRRKICTDLKRVDCANVKPEG